MRRRKRAPAGWKSRYVIDRESAHRLAKEEEERVVRRSVIARASSRCLCNHLSRQRVYWDYLVMFLALINCFMVPVELAVDLPWMQDFWYSLLNILVDIIFIIDISVNFITTYDEGYDLISDRKRIANRYFKTRFTVDFVSAFPIDLIFIILVPDSESAVEFKAFSLLKLVRMLRLSRIIRALNVRKDLKSKIKLVKVFLELILYLHCQACLIMFIVIEDEIWDDPFQAMDPVLGSKFYSQSTLAQYLTSLYLSFLAMHCQDIYLRTTNGYMVGVITLCIGVVVQGNLLGVFAEIIYEINELDILAQSQADASHSAMTQVDLDKETKNTSINYVKTVTLELHHQKQVSLFLHQVSPNLINKANYHLLNLMVSPKVNNKIFFLEKEMSRDVIEREVYDLSKLLILQERSLQSVIMNERDVCDGLYIVQKGKVGGMLIGRNGEAFQIEERAESQLIGEISFFLNTKRTATLICLSNVRVFFLDIRYKKTLLQLCPILFRRMRHQIYSYTDDVFEYKLNLLKHSVSYFKDAEREALVEIAVQMEMQSFNKETMVLPYKQDIKHIIVVYEGMLHAYLPTSNIGLSLEKFLFEKFPIRSSYGLYAILQKDKKGKSLKNRFNLTTKSFSWVVKISEDLLRSVQQKFPILNRHIKQTEEYLKWEKTPLCDFQIDHQEMEAHKDHIYKQKSLLIQAEERREQIQFLKARESKIRTLVKLDHGEVDEADEAESQISEIACGNEILMDSNCLNISELSLESHLRVDSHLSLSLNSSLGHSSFLHRKNVRSLSTAALRKKRFTQALIRAVRRQILINTHLRHQLKNFKVTDNLVQKSEQKEGKNCSLQHHLQPKQNFEFETKLLERMNEQEIADEIEGATVVVHQNQKSVNKIWTNLVTAIVSQAKRKLDAYERLQNQLDLSKVPKGTTTIQRRQQIQAMIAARQKDKEPIIVELRHN